MSLLQIFGDLSLPLNPQLCWLFTLALLNTLWQGLLIAVMLHLVLQLGLSFRRRFQIAFLSLLIIATLPVANFIWQNAGKTPTPVEVAHQEFQRTGALKLFPLDSINQQRKTRKLAVGDEISMQASNMSAVDRDSPPKMTSTITHWTVSVYLVVTLLYLLGGMAMTARLLFGIRQQRRLYQLSYRIQEAIRLPDRVVSIAEKAAKSLGGKSVIPIHVFSGSGAAVVAGIFRPAIYLNVSLISGLTPAQLEQVLAHELAHVYRWDPVTQLIQRIIESWLYFHPAVWYVSHRVSDLRELSCDEMVADAYDRHRRSNLARSERRRQF